MRVVFDTVLFVRALINPGSRWGRLLFDLSDRYVLVLSPEIIKEILDVLHRSSLRERYPQIDRVAVDRVLTLIERATIVTPDDALSVCRDPDDNKLFESAVAGQAHYIVSEDRDVLDVGEFRGVETVSAEEFIRIISSA